MGNPALVVRVSANLEELKKNLKEGRAVIDVTTAGMTKLATSLSGERLSQQAHNIVGAISQIGGVSKLTDSEATRLLGTLDRAIDKAQHMGTTVPAGWRLTAEALRKTDETAVVTAAQMEQLGIRVEGTGNRVGSFRAGLSEVDRTLAAVGIQIGPQVSALGELANAYGRTASQLGLVATAGLGVAAAMGGWQIGRWIADIAGLDDSIANLTARLMGYGDLAAEEAAAKTETLARASQMAGREITSVAEAARILQQETDKTVATHTDFITILSQAQHELRGLTDADLVQIEAAGKVGGSHEQLALKFGVSTTAIALAKEKIQEKSQADAAAAAAAKKHQDALEELRSAGDGWRGTLEQIDPVLVNQIAKYLEAGVSQQALATAYSLTDTQVKAVKRSLEEQHTVLDALVRKQQEWATAQVQASQEAGRLWDEYHALRIAQGGTTVDTQIAQIDRWKSETIRKLQEAQQYNEETATAIEAVWQAKLDAVSIDWQTVGQTSHRSLEQQAQKAEATFQYILAHADQFTTEQIADAERERDAKRAAVDNWGSAYTSTYDLIRSDSRRTADQQIEDAARSAGAAQEAARKTALSWQDAMTLVTRGLGTMTATIQAPEDTPEARADILRAWAEGRYYGPVVGGNQANPRGTGPDWSRIFRRESGGPVAAREAYLVGERGPEMFVPSHAGRIVPNSGTAAFASSGASTVQVHITINGSVLSDEQKIARVVGDAVMQSLRGRGERFPSYA